MANIGQLPSEVQSMIVNDCDRDSLQSLYLTSTRLRDATEAKLYEEITLDETESKGAALLAIADGPRASLVHSILYTPSDPRPIGSDDHDDGIELSEATKQALRSLHKFPNLETFRFRCDIGGWDYNNWPEGAYHFWEDTREYAEGALEPEEKEPCRRLLNGSLLALSKSAGAFKALELYHLPPIPTTEGGYSAFGTESWKTLIQGLKSFDLQLAGCYGQGALNMTVAHQEYIANFVDHTVRNLTNVEHLRLAGDPEGVIGNFDAQEPFDWEKLDLAHLKKFELEWSSFEQGMPHFLAKHAERSVEEIYLRRCFTNSIGAWKRFLEAIRGSQPPKLVKVDIEPYPILKRAMFGDEYEIINEDFYQKWKKGEITLDLD